jgi:hypothetical protein
MMRVNRPPNEESYEQRGCGKNSNQYGLAHCIYSQERTQTESIVPPR